MSEPMSTRYEVRGEVAVVTLDDPPVNGLGHAVRSGILDGLRRAQADPAVKAIVVIGAGKGFSGGADIRELGTPLAAAEPNLHTLIREVEASAKPVVAALGGICLGGGLELALRCHYRVSLPDAQLGLPEVKLGLLPGAGGTQRLPRAAGLEAALQLIVSGDAAPAARFRGTPLVDEVLAGDLLEGALAFATRLGAAAGAPRRTRDLPIEHSDAEGFLRQAGERVDRAAGPLPAPRACLEALAAAVSLPFEAGLRVERELFAALMATPASRALRHAFFAERAAARVPGVAADAPVRPVRRVAVIGAGTMGSGIAMSFLAAGFPVTLLEAAPAALDRGVATLRDQYARMVAKGRLSEEGMARRLDLLRPTLSYDDLGDADLVIEAVFEEMPVKEGVFRQLDAAARPGAILATNTSTLDVDRIAAVTARPQDVLGTHFFSPAQVMKLLEVVRGAATATDVLATVMRLARTIGKTAVVSGVCDGFIGNRMLEGYVRQAFLLLEEGASPQQVDRALEAFGFAMGIFRVSDLAGNDIGWAIRKRRYRERPGQPRAAIADRLCEQGRFGQKAGRGWYRYEPGGRDAIPDPEVDELIAGRRRELGITPRAIDDAEIVERCVYALVNEGARILEEGIARRASDVDVVYLTGYGFPRHRGGPMFFADEVGLDQVVRATRRFAGNPHADPEFWQPAPLLARLAAAGATFQGASGADG